MAIWYGLCNTVTQLQFDDLWRTMQTTLFLAVTSYLEETWLLHKEKFVKVWMQHIPHYKLVVTSHVEGGHATTKA